MNREQVKKLLPILQAFAEGKTIEIRTNPKSIANPSMPNDWVVMDELECWANIEYRIKPSSKYRPYQSIKECFHDMENHKPFGYLRKKQKGDIVLIIGVHNDGYPYLRLSMPNVATKFTSVFEEYVYLDGQPFGVKVGKE